MLKTRIAFVLGAILLTGILSCSIPGDVRRAKEEVIAIRALIKAKNIEQIYRDASAEFRDAARKSDLEDIFEGHYDEIGNTENFELLQTKIEKESPDGPFLLILGYKAKSTTSAINLDEFIFLIKDGNPRLFNYRYELRSENK